MSQDTVWDDKTTEWALALKAQGKTAQEISDMMTGVSRSAVSGMFRRARTRMERGCAPAALGRPKGNWRGGIPAAIPTIPANDPHELKIVEPDKKFWGSCKWPIGEPGARQFHVCGREAAKGVGRDGKPKTMPYCERHCDAAYKNWREVQMPARRRA